MVLVKLMVLGRFVVFLIVLVYVKVKVLVKNMVLAGVMILIIVIVFVKVCIGRSCNGFGKSYGIVFSSTVCLFNKLLYW